MSLPRRDFLASGLVSGAACGFVGHQRLFEAAAEGSESGHRLRFAPHFGQFRHHAGDDAAAQLRFLRSAGFSALEDLGLMDRSPREQRRLGQEARRLGVRLGPFYASVEFRHATFSASDHRFETSVIPALKRAVTTSRVTGATQCIVVPGRRDARETLVRQWDRAIERMRRRLAETATESLTFLIEPVQRANGGSRMLVSDLNDALRFCQDVADPRCQVMCDVYAWSTETSPHRPIATLLSTLRDALPWVGHIQVGDAPGRKEPGSGQLDFDSLFAWLKDRRYSGLIGMDHGASTPGRSGEERLLAAYESWKNGDRSAIERSFA